MPRPVTMPIANDKRRRPERTEAIRILKPAISNIPKSVSATVAAHANDTVDELGKRDVTAPVSPFQVFLEPDISVIVQCLPQRQLYSGAWIRTQIPEFLLQP